MEGENVRDIIDKLRKYAELRGEEAVELSEELDTLYNHLKARYLDILWEMKDTEAVNKLVELALSLLEKSERSLIEELALIALLDIFATDLYDKFVGPIVRE